MRYKFNPITGALDVVDNIDETILKGEDIGVTVQPYNINTVVDVEYESIKLLAQTALQSGDNNITWASMNW